MSVLMRYDYWRWLDETYPRPPFLPSDTWTRAQIGTFALVIASDIDSLNNLSVLGRLNAQFGAGNEAISEWYRHWISLGFTTLEAQLAQRQETPFAFGDQPTLEDALPQTR
jgi:maleylpyruvate isomerase